MNVEKAMRRGIKAQQEGRLDAALKLYRQVLKAKPSNAHAHACVGSVYITLGKADAGLTSIRRAVELAPNDPNCHNSLGAALTLTGALDEGQRSFERALELEPRHIGALCNLGRLYTGQQKYAEAAQCFERALAIEPKNAPAANDLGNCMLALGRKDQAALFYKHAVQVDPQFTFARANLNALIAREVPQWHFDMLADDARNQVYREAIERAVTSESRVLDIGTGTGLLSMIAARAGAASVVTCEMSTFVAQSAQTIIAANGYGDHIKLYNKPSTQLVIGQELPQKATLLVSEILDNKILGEGALPSLRHATEELLEPGGAMIPQAARLKAILVAAPKRRETHPLRGICGFNLSPFEQFRDPTRSITTRLDQEELVPLSDVFTAFEIDFANLPPAASDAAPNRRTHDIEVTADGNVQAVAFWFELDLDDQLRVSSGVDGELKHWQQNLHMYLEDLRVQKGQNVRLEVTHSDHSLRFMAPKLV